VAVSAARVPSAAEFSRERRIKGGIRGHACGVSAEIQYKEASMPVKAIPDGYHTVTPYLIVRGAAKTIEFLKKAFGAEYAFEPMLQPNGAIMHAEVKIGDSRVMISDATDKHPPLQSMIHLYVPDVDAAYKRALAAGGMSTMEPMDQFYGDRGGSVKDPTGNHWYIATHMEDVQPAELKKRAEAHMKKMQGKAA
jgi:uncharacterized glyoxalase superfamily protein PhnB